jgi:hypothetical protein
MDNPGPVGALRPKAAAHYLGISVSALRDSAVRKTYLPGRSLKRGILVYRVVDLDAYLERFAEQPVTMQTTRRRDTGNSAR